MAGFAPEVISLLRSLGAGGLLIGTGKVYWVDSIRGDDGNVGTRPDEAFETIIEALEHCVDDNNDYIMVIEDYDEGETILVTKSRVHIIGLGNSLRPNSNQPFVALTASGDFPVFTINEPAGHVEIAGFAIGGGPNHAGIENAIGAVQGAHIHDCAFGHSFSGGTPQDGIWIRVNATNIRVENCSFYGTPTGKGLLTRDGYRYDAGTPLNGTLKDNQFLGVPVKGINILATNNDGGLTIQDNIFHCPDVQGAAITLGATVFGCLVVGNKAVYGNGAVAMVENPYLDNTVGAPYNAWIANYKGNALINPA
ncbi:hypothetical protein ES703_114351 [subsurface metagenome]